MESKKRLYSVVIFSNCKGSFTYQSDDIVDIYSRVEVPFGRQKQVLAMVIAEVKPCDLNPKWRLRKISRIVDSAGIISKEIFGLAEWIHKYYRYPLGAVLNTMLPGSQKRRSTVAWSLSNSGQKKWGEHNFLQILFPLKKDSQSREDLKNIVKEHHQTFELIYQKKTAHKIIADLISDGTLEKKTQSLREGRALKELPTKKDLIINRRPFDELTDQQKDALEGIFLEGAPISKPVLLFGVTGSGKTEVFLQSIAKILSENKDAQILCCVPEIGLTPQISELFEARFPGLTAVVHSNLTSEARWHQWAMVENGSVRILVGPRSAIFAPFRNLSLIIIDEEHDSSYKQTSGLYYHGRDIAVVRANMEGARLILASATPSLESYANAKRNKYRLISMDKRVGDQKLPSIKCILPLSTKKKANLLSPERPQLIPAKDLIDPEIMDALRENLEQGNQSIIILNRRGYSFYLYDLDKKAPIECPRCSITLTFHRSGSHLKCHYCDYAQSLQETWAKNPSGKLLSVGFGSEQTEEFLLSQFSKAKVLRFDSDSIQTSTQLFDSLQKVREGKVDILVGTQMLAKGHDFPNVTLTVILGLDQMLNMPDLRSGERTFQLLVQSAGRAGRSNKGGKVLVQTINEHHPLLTSAANHDYQTFANNELIFREKMGYPPYTRCLQIQLSSLSETVVDDFCELVESWLEAGRTQRPQWFLELTILGPATPSVARMNKRYRRNIVVFCQNLPSLYKFMRGFEERFPSTSNLRVTLEMDPQSLM